MTVLIEDETVGDVSLLRRDLWATGRYRPIALCNWDSDPERSPGKRPVGDAWQRRAQQNPPEAAACDASPDALNTGIWAGGLRAVDVDFDDAVNADMVRFIVENRLGPTIMRVRDNSPRVLLVYRAANKESPYRVTPKAACGGKVEVLGTGKQFAAFGRHHTGARLEWPNGSPLTVTLSDLPAVTENQVMACLAAVCEFLRIAPKSNPAVAADAAVAPSGDKARGFTAPPSEAKVVELLSLLPNPADADREIYTKVMTGAVACIIALGGDPKIPDSPIAAAAIAWAKQYEAHDDITDERQKWVRDWSKRTRQLAGWQSLLAVSRHLIPGSALEFESLPPGRRTRTAGNPCCA